MSTLNIKNNAVSVGLKKANHEGSVQHVKSPEQQLLEITVMTLWGKDSFYEANDTRLIRIRALVNTIVEKGNLDFIANVIRYARTEMHIRSVPIIVAICFTEALRKNNVTYSHMRKLICDTIQRADQINDMYAVAILVYGDSTDQKKAKRVIPTAIKRGVADAFNKFNEYHFGKWNRSNSVKFSDVLRVVHPTPITPEQGELFSRIIAGTVAVPDTHEVFFSTNGQLPVAERKPNAVIWDELTTNKKLGYQATLMNVRRMLNDEVSRDTLFAVAARLTDPKEVAKSKMLPFQFVAAYNAIQEVRHTPNANLIVNALTDAIDISLTNIPVIGDNIIIIIDLSASMQTYSAASRYNRNGFAQTTGTPATIAAMFAAALFKANVNARNITLIGFSDDASFVRANSRDSVVSIKEMILHQTRAGGTNLYGACEFIKANVKFVPDTVVLLSDMQIQDAASLYWNVRSFDIQPYFPKDSIKIAINLDAYDTTCAPEYKGWIQLQGWSPKIFDMIPTMRENNIKSVVKLLLGPYHC